MLHRGGLGMDRLSMGTCPSSFVSICRDTASSDSSVLEH